MAARPEVTVAVAALDPHPAYLREAVASVLGQTFADWELLVVEDPGRTAGAAVVLEGFGDPRIRLHRNAARTSLSAQRDLALRLARAPLVAVLDADDVCAPHRLERQVAFLRAHPDVAVAGSHIFVLDGEGRTLGRRRYPTTHGAILRAMPFYNPLAHSSVVVRPSEVLAAGGYSCGPPSLVEDYDLWSRMAARGAVFANLDEALAGYRIHPRAGKRTRLRETLRATLEVKRARWGGRMGAAARARMWAERALLLLPPSAVFHLFLRTHLLRG